MTTKVSSKIAKFAHDYRSRLLQEQGKTAAKMTKYDVALFMKNNGVLTESEFDSWVKEREGQEALQLTNQQLDAIKSGTIFNFTVGLQSYLDSDEVSDFTLGNVLGFEKTTNEQTGQTTTQSKEVSKKKFSVAEEMKKQSFYNYIKSLPTPEATYTELMRSIEFDKLSYDDQIEMSLKIAGEKFNEAKEKGDKQTMKGYLKEGIFLAWQVACQKVDSAVGIKQAKDMIKNSAIFNAIIESIDKLVDDGDDTNLSSMEKNWEGIKGFGDALDSFIGTQAITFIGGLHLLSGAAAGLAAFGEVWGAVGQVINGAIKLYFLKDGAEMMYNGAGGYYNAETKQEARRSGQEFGMGSVIFTGTLRSMISDIKAYRASHAISNGQGGLPELSEINKAVLEQNLPDIQNKAQVSANLAFLQQNGVEIVKYTPEAGFDLIVNGKSVQVKAQGEAGFETTLSGLVENIKSEVAPETTGTAAKLPETIKENVEQVQEHATTSGGENKNPVTNPEILNLETIDGRMNYAKSQGLKENSITPAEVEVMYKKRGFTDADIEEVRKANPDADKWMQTFEIFSEIKESDTNLDNMSVAKIKEEIIDMADEKLADQRLFVFINEENLKWAQENFRSPDRMNAIKDLFQFLDELEDSKADFPEKYRIAKLAQKLTGEPFAKLMNDAGMIWSEEQLVSFTPERIMAAKKISDALGREFELFDARDIENPELITPEFLKEYKSAKEQLEEMNITFDSGMRNPVNYLTDVEKAVELIKKEGLDFTWYQGIEGSTTVPGTIVQKILDNPQKLHSIKVFMDICSPEAKAEYSHNIVTLAFEEGADNPQGVGKLINQLAKDMRKDSVFDPKNFINTINDYGRKDNINWQGVANLLEVYVKNNLLFEPEKYMVVANGDYNGAVKLLNELKTFFDKEEGNLIGSESSGLIEDRYMSFLLNYWSKIIRNENVDFNKATERVKQLEEKFLPSDIGDYETFERILISEDNGIVEKLEIVSKKGLKAEYDRIVNYIDNPNVTVEDFTRNLELLDRFSKGSDIKLAKQLNADMRLRLANSVLTNKELVDLFDRIGDKLSNEDKIYLFGACSHDGAYSGFIQSALNVINKMIKENFPPKDFSLIMKSLRKANAEDFIQKLVFDKNTKLPTEIASEILSKTNGPVEKELAEILCFDKELNFPKDEIPKILERLNQINTGLATKLCTDKELNYPKDKIAELIHTAGYSQAKADFIEKMVYTKDFSHNNIVKISNSVVSEAKMDEIEQAFNTPEIRKWADKILGDFDVETVINLARTQKKLFAEAKQANEAVEMQIRKEAARQMQLEHQAADIKADPMALDKISSALMELGVPEGMAKNAYAKLCVDSNGNVDYTKLDAAKSLIKVYGFYTRVNKKGQTAINPNLTPKDITEIFKLATGDKMSAQNGEFRPQFVQDIIALKECGIDDIKFALNLASVKNMSLIEMKARFKGETRQDIAKRIDEGVNNEVKDALKSRGIDLEAIKEKALTSDKKITDMTIKEGQGQTGKIRSLDAIVGTERVVLNKFKADVDQSIWQDEAAFKRWAEEKLEDITDWEKHPEYLAKGRFDVYNQPRRDAFEKWVEYLNSEECNVHDDVFAKILFLDGLTSEMKPDNAYTPPEISHGAFEAVYNQLLEGNTTVSLTKAYASFNRTKAIQKYGKETTSKDGVNGIWVRIPQGGQRGEPLYDEHIAMIQALSEGSSWCLRFENAHTYLGYGDLHFFVTKQPDGSLVSQTAINVLPNGTIREIEKRYNQDRSVPVPYVQVIKEWKEANGFTGMELQMEQALKAKPEFDRQKAKFAELQKNGDVKGIFNELGVEVGDYEGGGYYIKGSNTQLVTYNPFIKGKPYTLFDLGVDENWLMKDVVQIVGSMHLEGSALISAPKLKCVTGYINFGDNKISDLRSLENLGGKQVQWEKPVVKTPAERREEGIRYNEKEEPQGTSREEIMRRVAEMEAEYEAKEAAEKGEEKKIPTWEELQARRLPDYREVEDFDQDFLDDLNRMDYTIIDITEFKKEASIINNKQLRTITENICKNGQLSRVLLNYIRDVDAGLENINDTKLLKHIKNELTKMASFDYKASGDYEVEFEYFDILSDVGELIDVYNTMTGRYSRYKAAELTGENIYQDKSKPTEYIRDFRRYSPRVLDSFIKRLYSKEAEIYPKVADFESLQRTESLEILSQKKEMLDYMYEKYYLSTIKDVTTKKLCKEISRKYGVRVLLSKKTRNIRRALTVIKNELESWTKVSGGKAKLPKILDLNTCDAKFETAAAYADIRGNIHHDGAKISSSGVIRHEIMHLNQPMSVFARFSSDPELVNLMRSIMPSMKIEVDGKVEEVLDYDNCKYREEFLKAGIDPEHIEYAYTNREEFLSVAAEGDLSKYSPEFKQILIKIGMPEYVFELPLNDINTDVNVVMMEEVLKEHPDATYDELVEYFEEKRENLHNRAASLFDVVFGEMFKK